MVKIPPANTEEQEMWVEKIPWRRKRQPARVFLPGKSHGQKSLVSYCPWGHKGFPGGTAVKNLPANAGDSREDPPE